MDNSQILKQLEELKQQVDILKKDFATEKFLPYEELKRDYSIKLDTAKYFSSGNAAFGGYASKTAINDISSSEQAVIFIGKDRELGRAGIDNTQMTLLRDNVNNQAYMLSMSGIILNAIDGIGKAGSTTIHSNSAKALQAENLTNHLITFRCDNGLYYGSYIVSNEGNHLTLASALPDDMSEKDFLIYTPVFLGSPLVPWERLYVTSGTAGGVRFGEGTTTGGQNGLLYMNSSGNLFWRTPAGASTQLN